MDREKLRRYAEVIIRRGIYLKEGQPLYIEADTDAEILACALVEEAYRAGASEIAVSFQSRQIERQKLLKFGEGTGESLLPDLGAADRYAAKNAAYIRIESVDLDVFHGIPADVMQKKAVAEREKRTRYTQKAKNVQTCVVCCPTPSWAKLVYPGLDADEALEHLWEAVFHCARIDETDPIGAWDNYIANSRLRRSKLSEKRYETFHYIAEETDLYLSPVDSQFWFGGCIETPDGGMFVPNIPTEEIFTCPHKYKSEGYVTSSRPLIFQGQMIEHFTLTLREGKVVDFRADRGQDMLKAILETDAGSCYFGEMALVDKQSPICSLNTNFYTTLYDENASCHIALGLAMDGDPHELDRLGINVSSLHVDFMVGTENMSIRGLTADGRWEDVFIDGSWADAFRI